MEVLNMSALFINGSPNKNGNTAKLASRVLKGKEYETLNLTDYKLYSYGQDFKDDQFEEIYEKNEKGGHHRDRIPRLLAQYVRRGEKFAGSLLWSCQHRIIIREKDGVCISGSCAGTLDAGERGIHHESFFQYIRYGICGNGGK